MTLNCRGTFFHHFITIHWRLITGEENCIDILVKLIRISLIGDSKLLIDLSNWIFLVSKFCAVLSARMRICLLIEEHAGFLLMHEFLH